jgi:hypothetical protein
MGHWTGTDSPLGMTASGGAHQQLTATIVLRPPVALHPWDPSCWTAQGKLGQAMCQN